MRRPQKSAEYLKQWRRCFRERVAAAFGGVCGVCGYKRCLRALELHHLDPLVKEFSLGNVITRAKNWQKVVAELRKCVMLCANCHREVHDNLMQVPQNITRFDESYADYKAPKMEKCPVCKGPKRIGPPTCSRTCAMKSLERAKWPENLPELVAQSSKVAVARALGVTDKAVAKRLKNHHGATMANWDKLGLPTDDITRKLCEAIKSKIVLPPRWSFGSGPAITHEQALIIEATDSIKKIGILIDTEEKCVIVRNEQPGESWRFSLNDIDGICWRFTHCLLSGS